MAQPKSLLDPFDLFRGMAARLERGLEQAADRGVRSTGFTRAMHQALDASLLVRRLSTQIQDGLLGALNLPTRADVLRLGERLQALEDRIIALSADLAARDSPYRAVPTAVALPSPPRTKKPPQAAAPAAAGTKRLRRKARP
jgi:hypothetical protein